MSEVSLQVLVLEHRYEADVWQRRCVCKNPVLTKRARPVSSPVSAVDEEQQPCNYRGTSLIRNAPLLGPYSRLYLGSYGGPRGEGLFLMSEVSL